MVCYTTNMVSIWIQTRRHGGISMQSTNSNSKNFVCAMIKKQSPQMYYFYWHLMSPLGVIDKLVMYEWAVFRITWKISYYNTAMPSSSTKVTVILWTLWTEYECRYCWTKLTLRYVQPPQPGPTEHPLKLKAQVSQDSARLRRAVCWTPSKQYCLHYSTLWH